MSIDIELLLEEKIFSYNEEFRDEEEKNEKDYHFIVIGAGGTGGYLIPNLARMVGIKNEEGFSHRITIVDKDDVEEKNLLRQNFSPNDIGKNKAEVMASRYGRAFGETIFYLDEYIETADRVSELIQESNMNAVIIDAVDNNKTRFILKQGIEDYHSTTRNLGHDTVMISSGNEEYAGQVVFSYTIGTYKNPYIRAGYRINSPDIVDIFPTMNIGQLPDEESCAERAVSAPQNISTNITAADIIFGFANKLLNNITIDTLVYFFDSQTMTRKAYSGRETHVRELLTMTENNAGLYNFFPEEILSAPSQDELVYPPSYEDIINSNQEAEQAIVANAQEQEEVEELMSQAIEEAENNREDSNQVTPFSSQEEDFEYQEGTRLWRELQEEKALEIIYENWLTRLPAYQESLSFENFKNKMEDDYHDHKVEHGMLQHDDEDEVENLEADNSFITPTEVFFSPTGPGPVGERGVRAGTREEYDYYELIREHEEDSEHAEYEIKGIQTMYDNYMEEFDSENILPFLDYVETLEESYNRHKMSVGMLTHLIDTNEEETEEVENVEQSNLFTEEEFDSFLAVDRLDELDTFEESGLDINEFNCFKEPFQSIDGSRINNLSYRLSKHFSILDKDFREREYLDSFDEIRDKDHLDYIEDLIIILEDEDIVNNELVYQKNGGIYVNDALIVERYEVYNILGPQDWKNPVWAKDYLKINIQRDSTSYQQAQKLISLREELNLTFNQTAFVTLHKPSYYIKLEYGDTSLPLRHYSEAIEKLEELIDKIERANNEIFDDINNTITIGNHVISRDVKGNSTFAQTVRSIQESREPMINNEDDLEEARPVEEPLNRYNIPLSQIDAETMVENMIAIEETLSASVEYKDWSVNEKIIIWDLIDDLNHLIDRITSHFADDDNYFYLNEEGFTMLEDTIIHRGDIREFMYRATRFEAGTLPRRQDETIQYTIQRHYLPDVNVENTIEILNEIAAFLENDLHENEYEYSRADKNYINDLMSEVLTVASNITSQATRNPEAEFVVDVAGGTVLNAVEVCPEDIRTFILKFTDIDYETLPYSIVVKDIGVEEIRASLNGSLGLRPEIEDISNIDVRTTLDRMADIESNLDYHVQNLIDEGANSGLVFNDIYKLSKNMKDVGHAIHIEYMKDDQAQFSLNEEGFTLVNEQVVYRGDIRDLVEEEEDSFLELSVSDLISKLSSISDINETIGDMYEENTVFLAGEEINAYDAHNELEEIISTLKSVKRENEDKGFSLVDGVTFLYNEPIYTGDIRELLNDDVD